MTRQIHLTAFNVWANIIAECETFILAKDIDGVMTYMIKDGMQRVRVI